MQASNNPKCISLLASEEPFPVAQRVRMRQMFEIDIPVPLLCCLVLGRLSGWLLLLY